MNCSCSRSHADASGTRRESNVLMVSARARAGSVGMIGMFAVEVARGAFAEAQAASGDQAPIISRTAEQRRQASPLAGAAGRRHSGQLKDERIPQLAWRSPTGGAQTPNDPGTGGSAMGRQRAGLRRPSSAAGATSATARSQQRPTRETSGCPPARSTPTIPRRRPTLCAGCAATTDLIEHKRRLPRRVGRREALQARGGGVLAAGGSAGRARALGGE